MTAEVSVRLADGEAAVARAEIYAAAARAVGYGGPVTAREVRDRYDTERGMRLSALDADASALSAAAAGAEEALRAGEQAAGLLRQSWRGESASAAADFVDRQCAAGADVVAGLANAAVVLTALRETLAVAVNAKVEAVVRIDDRRAAEHRGWLGAAHAVLGGSADAAAIGLVESRIVPYVDGEIGGDWLTAMRSGTAAVAAAYDEALDRLRVHARPRFEQPVPPGGVRPGPGARAVRAEPSGSAAPPEWSEPGSAPSSWSPAGIPDPGGGLAGLVSEIAGLLGGYADPLLPPDPFGPVDPFGPGEALDEAGPSAESGEEPAEEAEEAGAEAGEAEAEAEEAGAEAGEETGDEAEDAGEPEQPREPAGELADDAVATAEPLAAEVGGLPPVEAGGLPPVEAGVPLPAVEPDPEELTPCEIAADELPQVGR